MKLQRYDLSYFLGKFFFDVFQNMFAYRSTFNILELKEDKSTVVLLVGNQKGYILLNLHHYLLFSYITYINTIRNTIR